MTREIIDIEPARVSDDLDVVDDERRADLESDDQILSRDRVRDLAEVYTHEREVNAMLDLIPDMFPSPNDSGNTDRTFLEPACGSGNFLVEILRRKVAFVTTRRYGKGERFEYRVLRCLASVYGIDIRQDNVARSRDRLRGVLEDHLGGLPVSEGLTGALGVILSTNIQRADTLANAREVELVAYQPVGGGRFLREWSFLEENEATLFTDPTPRRDEVPVHYSDLAKHPGPAHKREDKG